MSPFGRFAGLGAMATMLACGGPTGQERSGGAQVIVTTATTVTGDSATFGAAGGTLLSPDGVGVRIPPGALSGDTNIEVAPSELVPPSVLSPLSKAYDFLPANQTYADKVTLELPLPAGTIVAVVYLSRADGTGWDLVGGASWEGSIKADVTRFGTAFAAAAK